MEVVSGVSIEVAAGETVALIGRNGAGKTTTLLALAGLRYGASAGRVTLNGVDLSRATPAHIVDMGIAHVPEGHRVFTQLTVADNLKLGAYHRRRSGRGTIDASMKRVFDLFPILRDYANRKAGLLSGGEQQMVAIGQALMAEPKVLLLDEPTSGLALKVIGAILDVLAQFRAAGMAILIVEQSVPRALSFADRCYVMERGRIVLEGDARGLANDSRVLDIVRGTSAAAALHAVADNSDGPPADQQP
jgi:branched-chain amino acid transport system ATP-binding protein